MIYIRRAILSDFYKGHVNLYKQLSDTINSISEEQYRSIIESQSDTYAIFVIEDALQIVGTITILLEQKIIHNFGKVAHIEDVVIHENYRNKKYGKAIIDFAIKYAQQYNCYKILLDCKEEYMLFYEKCGFLKKGYMMVIYVQ